MILGERYSLVSRESAEIGDYHAVKALLYLDTDDHQLLLLRCLQKAVPIIETYTGIAIGEQVRRVTFDQLDEPTRLLYGPIVSQDTISTGGVLNVLTGVLTADWPTGGSVTYTTGVYQEYPANLLGAIERLAAELSGLNPALEKGGWKALAREFRRNTWVQ